MNQDWLDLSREVGPCQADAQDKTADEGNQHENHDQFGIDSHCGVLLVSI